MDIQYVGGVLLAVFDRQGDRTCTTTGAAEDAYYKRHVSTDRFYSRGAPFVVAVGVGLAVIAFWPL